MQAIKTVGKSGQISVGKALAGRDFIMEELPGGDIMLKRAVVVAMTERVLSAEVQADVNASRQWRRSHPAHKTDLDALAANLGISEE